jgi:hypothetical protein
LIAGGLPMRPDPARIEAAILDELGKLAPGRTLGATDIARCLAPDSDWHGLMGPVRRAAVALALSGRLVIYRKGKPVDPSDFKGVWRMGLPRHE